MTVDKIFFGYMAAIGLVVGAIVVAFPQVRDFVFKPYFWVLLAVITFDAGIYLRTRTNPGAVLPMPARLFGFLIGIVMMVAVPTLTRSPGGLF